MLNNISKFTILKNNIYVYRTAMGISQSELGHIVGVSKNTISAYENGIYSPSAFIAFLLCQAFHCTFDDLFYIVDTDPGEINYNTI